MERWEPPKPQENTTVRKRRTRPVRERIDLPEVWLMVAARLGIALVFLLAVLFQRFRDQTHFAALALLAALVLLAYQSNQTRTRRLRDQAIVDLSIFLAVVPTIVLMGFVAAQTGELLPAERGALIETAIASLVSLAVLAGICYYFFADDRAILAAGMLPGWLIVVSLTFVLHDYRNQTVLGMIAVSYFIAAVSVSLAILVEEPLRRYTPAMFYAASLVVGLFLFDPGLGNLGQRDTIVGLIIWTLIGIGMIVLITVPDTRLDPGRMFYSNGRRRGRPIGHEKRRENDISQPTER